MDTERKRLVLDHLHGLLTLEQVGEALGVSVQRAYQIKQQLFKQYRIPEKYWNDGPAAARIVAALDPRNGVWAYTPGYHYHFERNER